MINIEMIGTGIVLLGGIVTYFYGMNKLKENKKLTTEEKGIEAQRLQIVATDTIKANGIKLAEEITEEVIDYYMKKNNLKDAQLAKNILKSAVYTLQVFEENKKEESKWKQQLSQIVADLNKNPQQIPLAVLPTVPTLTEVPVKRILTQEHQSQGF